MACVTPALSSSTWAHALPYLDRPLGPASATWNTKFPAASPAALYAPLPAPALPKQRPALRLPALAASSSDLHLPARRFDPFADDPVASTSQITPPPAPPRGRPLTPLVVASPVASPVASSSTSAAAPPLKGRRRAPSFSTGSPRSTPNILLSTPTLPPRATAPAPAVSGAPTPFHARHYPTPDARARLLARTLLNRIHAVGRPRSPYVSLSLPYARSASPYAGGGGGLCNGYESECGARGYVRSRLSECVAAC